MPISSLSKENSFLLNLLEGTAHETGEEFFRLLVKNLSKVLNTFGAVVSDYVPERKSLQPRAYWLGNKWIEPLEYKIAGTPCEKVIKKATMFHIKDRVMEVYPQDNMLVEFSLASYIGMPFKDREGNVIGNLAIVDTKPLNIEPEFKAIFEIFGARAAAEMLRLNAEKTVREREQQLGRLVDGAMDGIIDFDDELDVHLINPAAARMFDIEHGHAGINLNQYLADESQHKLRRYMQSFVDMPVEQRRIWISGGLDAKRTNDVPFKIEASLSQGANKGQYFYTLIIRDVNERIEAERKIRKLEEETAYLKDELLALQRNSEIIGESKAIQQAIKSIDQVAGTDASVLILGETGTGKELFARAIHENSQRKHKPLVTVNCAAIPKELVESEFFGHTKGAFTGAISHRVGRFEHANGGSIFLDEVGELPLDVQAKLLRVLQEGEFEPVGSTTSKKVDVRVIAATHRNLLEAVNKGEFREDLFYRLNVFPLNIPPLRDRGADIGLLANIFTQCCAKRMGRKIEGLSSDEINYLMSYHWPGNVRELQNVIERAVITAHRGKVNLNDILHLNKETEVPVTLSDADDVIRTADQMRELEVNNIRRALDACNGRVSGKGGAADLLCMKSSTLSARIKALGIK